MKLNRRLSVAALPAALALLSSQALAQGMAGMAGEGQIPSPYDGMYGSMGNVYSPYYRQFHAPGMGGMTGMAATSPRRGPGSRPGDPRHARPRLLAGPTPLPDAYAGCGWAGRRALSKPLRGHVRQHGQHLQPLLPAVPQPGHGRGSQARSRHVRTTRAARCAAAPGPPWGSLSDRDLRKCSQVFRGRHNPWERRPRRDRGSSVWFRCRGKPASGPMRYNDASNRRGCGASSVFQMLFWKTPGRGETPLPRVGRVLGPGWSVRGEAWLGQGVATGTGRGTGRGSRRRRSATSRLKAPRVSLMAATRASWPPGGFRRLR